MLLMMDEENAAAKILEKRMSERYAFRNFINNQALNLSYIMTNAFGGDAIPETTLRF